MDDGLVHIAFYDGLVHQPDAIIVQPGGFVVASPSGHMEVPPAGHVDVSPAGHVIIPIPPADQVIHVIQEGITGHIINQLV